MSQRGPQNNNWKGGVSADNMRYRARYVAKNKHKLAAQSAVRTEIRSGRLLRQPCEKCGNPKTHAHHDDYRRKLDIRWLCKSCHAAHHKEMRAIELRSQRDRQQLSLLEPKKLSP